MAFCVLRKYMPSGSVALTIGLMAASVKKNMAAFPECLLTCIFVLGVQQCLLASFPSAKHCLCECFSYSQRPAMRQVAAFCNYKHLFRCALHH